MATERLAPDAILAATGLTGTVSAIQDDPDSPDANWLTQPGPNVNTEVRVSFPAPSGSLTAGAGLQEFRVRVRKSSQSTNPTCTVEVRENNTLRATLVSGTAVSSTTGVVLSGTWNASLLSDATGASVECRVVGTVGGGSTSNRASLEVGAVEWNDDYTVGTNHTASPTDTVGVVDTAAQVMQAGSVPVDAAGLADGVGTTLDKVVVVTRTGTGG